MLTIRQLQIQGEWHECKQINLIVGGNNSGKTTFLDNLYTLLQDFSVNKTKWIDKADLNLAHVQTELENLFINPKLTYSLEDVQRKYLQTASIFNYVFPDESIRLAIEERGNEEQRLVIDLTDKLSRLAPVNQYFQYFSKAKTVYENCESRLGGVFFSKVENILYDYADSIQYLYGNPELFKKVQRHIKKVFGMDLVFDDLRQAELHIRLKPDRPPTTEEKSDLELYARYWLENSELVQTQGAGLKAYLKVILPFFNPAKDVILVDEPEAHLHPPQRRSLGAFIAQNAAEGKQIFIATHDSEFLRGILTQSEDNSKIFHLKRDGKKSHCTSLQWQFSRSHIYNEAVLNSFFNSQLVLCEAEDDRMFYQRAAERYLPEEVTNTAFLGLNGKSKVVDVYYNLYQSGLRPRCIFDIDYLYSCERLHDLPLSAFDSEFLLRLQSKLQVLLPSKLKKKEFRERGVHYFSDSELSQDIEQAIEKLKKIGIYIVPSGQLESWTETVKDHKRLQSMLNELQRKGTNEQLRRFLIEVVR